MNFLKRLFSKPEKPKTISSPSVQAQEMDTSTLIFADDYERLGISYPATAEETELVSVITCAIIAGDNPNSNVKIKSVYAIDEEKEVAAIMACSIAAESKPNSHFKIISIV